MLRLFTYGLYAVSCSDVDEHNAFTANWLSQVSFDPPLIALSVDNAAHSQAIIRRSRRFAVNVLADDQRELAGTLGKGYEQHPEKLQQVTFATGETGIAVIQEALAWVECLVETEVPAGDSTLFIGRVVGVNLIRDGEPLTMRAAGFRHAG